MTTQLIKITSNLSEKNVNELSDADLKRFFNEAHDVTVTGLRAMAVAYKEMRRRGLPTPPLVGLLSYVPQITSGQLAPETVIAFAGQMGAIRKMIGMPLDEQKKYAKGAPIPVTVRNASGKIEMIERPISEMSAAQVELAMDAGQLRPFAAQKRMLTSQPATKYMPTKVTVKANRNRGTIVIGTIHVRPSDLTRALRELGFELVREGKEPQTPQEIQAAAH